MKKIFILNLLLLAGVLSRAQQYTPFPTSGVEWTVVYYFAHCDEEEIDTTVYKYQLYGDTTMSGKLYSKLGMVQLNSGSSVPTIIGGIREDNKKIYYLRTENIHPLGPLPGSGEQLLYDFSAATGDMITHTSYGYPVSTVQQIDSVLIGGSYRKRFKIASPGPANEYWIEGIGSIGVGLLAKLTASPTCGTHIISSVCVTENGNLLYRKAEYQDCDATLSLTTPEWAAQINIFPNPAITGEIHINNIEPSKDIQAKVMDYTGRVLVTKTLKQGSNVITLPQTAVYILTLSDKQGRIVRVEKIVGG